MCFKKKSYKKLLKNNAYKFRKNFCLRIHKAKKKLSFQDLTRF